MDRLYVKRSEGGRGLLSVEDCVNIEVGSLFKYVVTSSERLLQAVTDEKILDEGVTKQSIRAERLTRYRNKALHRQFLEGTEEVRDPDSWDWLKTGTIKKETEGLLTAAQDQALRTNQE